MMRDTRSYNSIMSEIINKDAIEVRVMKLDELFRIEKKFFEGKRAFIITDRLEVAQKLQNMKVPKDHPLLGAVVFLVEDAGTYTSKELH